MKKIFIALLLAVGCLSFNITIHAQTVALDVQERWNAGDRTNSSTCNFDPSGLCPTGRGVLTNFLGETWLDMTCAATDPITGSNHRTEFAFGFDGDPRLSNNEFYHFETYFKDYLADVTSPNTCNHLFWQFKYGPYYPQLAGWIINQGGILKYQIVRQVSSIPDDNTFETQNTHVIGNVTSNAKVVWDLDIGWRFDNTGWIKIYINGTLVLNLVNIQTLDAQADPLHPKIPKFRMGPYCFGGFNIITSRSIYYRRVLIGNNDYTWSGWQARVADIVPPPPPPPPPPPGYVTWLFGNWQAVKVN